MTVDIRAAAEEYPGQREDDLKEAGFAAQWVPISIEKVRLLYALGRSTCRCCAEVREEDLAEFDTWWATLTPAREQIAEVLSQSYQEKYQPSGRLPVTHHDLRAADAVLGLARELTKRGRESGAPERTQSAPEMAQP